MSGMGMTSGLQEPMPAQAATPAQGMASSDGAAGAPGEPGFLEALSAVHDRHKAGYTKLKESVARLSATRSALDDLTKMGDLVTQEDVVKGASKLVAAGMGAAAVAGLLSEMPPDGAALQAWLLKHDADVAQREAQAKVATALQRHALGASALRLMVGHAAEGVGAEPAPVAPGGMMAEPAPGMAPPE